MSRRRRDFEQEQFRSETLPGKEEPPPGFRLRFDRWKRSWNLRDVASGIVCVGYTSRNDALLDAYAEVRARRDAQSIEAQAITAAE